MDISAVIEQQFSSIEAKIEACQVAAQKYTRYTNIVQGFVLFMGIITPIIVIFRKSELFPISFWVIWCTVTPPITAIISFLATHYGIKEKANNFAKMEKTFGLLVEKGKLRLATAKSEEDKTKLYEYIIEKRHRIEE